MFEVLVMARQRRPPVSEDQLRHLKYFRLLQPFLQRLQAVGTVRDRARNREIFFDQYVSLVLLYFFNPILTSLRSLQQATGLEKVQKRLGIQRTSLGSLSEATGVFEAEHLRHIVHELAERTLPMEHGRNAEALRGLTAVDGTVLPALPQMAWALWMDDRHRAAKLHLHFEVLKNAPVDATLTPAACSEPEQLRAMLQSGRLYVIDR